MKTPTLEEIRRSRTEAEADAAIDSVSAGAVRRCIPAQVNDDDVTLGAVVEEWKRLRSERGALAARVEGLRDVLWQAREVLSRCNLDGSATLHRRDVQPLRDAVAAYDAADASSGSALERGERDRIALLRRMAAFWRRVASGEQESKWSSEEARRALEMCGGSLLQALQISHGEVALRLVGWGDPIPAAPETPAAPFANPPWGEYSPAHEAARQAAPATAATTCASCALSARTGVAVWGGHTCAATPAKETGDAP
jgi:hypothetical protein